MASLIVQHEDKKVFTYILEKNETIIGRASDADLIVSAEYISREHFKITKKQNRYALIDVSKLGTEVNGQKVQEEFVLSNKDLIKIVDWSFEFLEDSKDPFEGDLSFETKIQNLDNDHFGTKILEYDQKNNVIKTIEPTVILENSNGQKSQINLKKNKQVLIGSSEDCHIFLDDSYVSRRHAILTLVKYGIKITDLNSTNGTLINGTKIKEKLISENETIQIGESKLIICFSELEEEPLKEANLIQNEFCGMIASSKKMKDIFAKVAKVSPTDMTVLIESPTGSGKEMLARAVHDLSPRKDKPYVIMNCGAISQNLAESELFGHEKGAFTGADQRHIGCFEQANGGTVFLDEVGELPLDLQAKLLRVLEYQSFKRVGGNEEIQVDVRVVAATHRDLSKMVAKEEFRQDLLYRLYVFPLSLPALKERREDISILTTHFLTQLRQKDSIVISKEAMEKLENHDWPGNVRELKNTLMRSLILMENNEITAKDIEFLQSIKVNTTSNQSFEKNQPISSSMEEFERNRILKALQNHNGDKNAAAKELGMGRSTLFRKIKNLNIS